MQRTNALKSEINQLTREISLTKDKLDTPRNSFLLAGEKKTKRDPDRTRENCKVFSNGPHLLICTYIKRNIGGCHVIVAI